MVKIKHKKGLNMAQYIENKLNGNGKRVAIAVAQFNELVTEGLLRGALSRLKALGVADDSITVAYVPGSFELPGVCRRFVDSKQYDAVLALGAVIRGETSHYEAVVQAVTSGIASLAAEGHIPVLFGVLTTDTVEQAMNRAGLKSGNKGADVAESAVSLMDLYSKI